MFFSLFTNVSNVLIRFQVLLFSSVKYVLTLFVSKLIVYITHNTLQNVIVKQKRITP